jgi:hypothetical protein
VENARAKRHELDAEVAIGKAPANQELIAPANSITTRGLVVPCTAAFRAAYERPVAAYATYACARAAARGPDAPLSSPFVRALLPTLLQAGDVWGADEGRRRA